MTKRRTPVEGIPNAIEAGPWHFANGGVQRQLFGEDGEPAGYQYLDGDDSILNATFEALVLACATVELHTGNGAREQVPWPLDAHGNIDYGALARGLRRAINASRVQPQIEVAQEMVRLDEKWRKP